MKTLLSSLLLALALSLNMTSMSLSREVPFTQEDRERLIRLEEGQKAINQRIDDLKDLIYLVLGGMIALIGFVIWDRRSALSPVLKKNKELEEQTNKIEKALKELAKRDPKIEEVLKYVGLL
ncbi:MAG: hypothetical protein ACK4K4_02490 [Caldimicrobium sp.]